MLSNLYKSSWTVIHQDGTRVIDNNALLEEKLRKARQLMKHSRENGQETEEEGFKDGLDAEKIDVLLASDPASVEALKKERDDVLAQIEQAQMELADLRSQADTMIDDAKTQIASMQMKAYEEAKGQGYAEGKRIGMQEAEAVRDEYLSKMQQNEREYQRQLESLEPEFVETLTGIYEHIFKVDLSRYRDLISNLLISAMQRIEDSRNFLVHVSKEDYESVLAGREYIRSEAGSAVTVEIVEDVTLSRSQCMIETENGVYDCSLDTQLAELGRKLKLLSYERTPEGNR